MKTIGLLASVALVLLSACSGSDVDGETVLRAFEQASEAACACPSRLGYPSRGNCLNDIDRLSEDARFTACVDRQLEVYGAGARAALACEADASRAFERCIEQINACDESLLDFCENEDEENLEACPALPGGFFEDVVDCYQ